MRCLICLLPLIFFGCQRVAPLPYVHPNLVVPEGGNVTLRVTNQSFAHNEIDLTITIDGEHIISDTYPVENQHHYVTYHLSLTPGPHDLQVESARGGVSKELTVDLSQGDHIDVSYWYYPPSHYDPMPPAIRIDVRDSIPGIR